jgi:replication-associated recombination protein RarA
MGLVKNSVGVQTPPQDPLHIRYRPKTLSDVIGQDAVVQSLTRMFKDRDVPHCFLFTGPSGTGKTTLARIVAASVGCAPVNLIEVDAARYSGIDAMRELLTGAQYAPLTASVVKAIIIDECHALSKPTWQTLLLSTEQPPPHLFWFFCTTEPDKVPATIRTRAMAYDLKPVRWDVLAEYMENIAIVEKMSVKKDFIEMAARRAQGSVRQGLVFLAILNGITDQADAARLVEGAETGEGAVIDLARMIATGKGFGWSAARKLVEELSDTSPETIRLTVVNYTATALMGSDDLKNVQRYLAVLNAFSQPCNPSERMAPILLSIGSLIF